MTRLIVRKDAYGRFFSCIVYIPREKVTVGLYKRLGHILLNALHGNEISQSMQLDDSVLARLHYVIHIPLEQRDQHEIDFPALEAKIIDASKCWQERFADLLPEHESDANVRILERYGHAFSLSYQEDFSPLEAMRDLQYLEDVYNKGGMAIRVEETEAPFLTLKLFQSEQAALSEVIPIFENMGLQALEENAYKCILQEKIVWVSCYHLKVREESKESFDVLKPLFYELFFGVWNKQVENDSLNTLVLKAAIPAGLVTVLRAYCAYYRQVTVYSQFYLENVLNKYSHISKKLLRLFALKCDPVNFDDAEAEVFRAEIKQDFTDVSNLEEDKVLRAMLALIDATLRTNYYLKKGYLSIKLLSSKVPGLPLPHPLYEVFVYAPQFEAIHLRAAKVARGGIRWSDRKEDFRTEVLGLMKAQQVKNTVIVPAGSKGGFILKDPQAAQPEAIECYKNFMRGLLDLTDNLVDGQIVPPVFVRTLDEADPYLVVAADKGTATFSDYANEVSNEYHFWLGDAFASGGSQGYDHKKIGITARGAWISVEAHLKALGINPEKDSFTAIGIGDMSGDVFGNGMLLSSQMKLVAAFNHRHIFLDPTPDVAASFEERKRLFALPRSSWTDYNPALISPGGGVFSRDAKSISLSKEVRQLLGIAEELVEPTALIRAILRAPVDLFFNGGIGTYVKASTERNHEVGDKHNDAVRVNANELRCKAVGEGGNLGFTQLARVEYAQQGGLIFTDFIDNSAGVDLSDHEVNTKILLAQAIQQGELSLADRNQLLLEMTNDVAHLVLKDNKHQTETLSYAASQSVGDLEVYIRWMHKFEQKGLLNREVEFLPTEKTLLTRLSSGQGLTAPEIAIVMAYVKMHLKHELLKSDLPEDPYFSALISKEFPVVLEKRFADAMKTHPLHREIVVTQLSNQLLNESGVLFIQRLKDETNATTAEIVSCFAMAREIFDLPHLYAMVKQLDFKVGLAVQHRMRRHLVRVIRRAARWMLHHQFGSHKVGEMLAKLGRIKSLFENMPSFLSGVALKKYEHLVEAYTKEGVPLDTATAVANVYSGFLLLGINNLAEEIQQPLPEVATMYFKLGEFLGVDWLRDEITNQAVNSGWEALLHSSLRDDLDHTQIVLAKKALLAKVTVDGLGVWLEPYAKALEAWRAIIAQLQYLNKADYVMYTVALNALTQLSKLIL